MRILQVVPHYIPAFQFGGPLRVAHSLGKALVRQGHEVTVCTTNIADSENDLPVPPDTPILIDNVSVYYEPTQLSRYWGFSLQLWKRLQQEMESAELVMIHFHYQFANWAGAFWARRMSRPYVLFSHGSFNRWGIQRKGSLRKKAYLRFVERQNIAHSLFIAFNSPEEKALSLFSDQGVVIPNGIDPEELHSLPTQGAWRNRYPVTQGKTCFLYLGRLNPYQKGLDLLISAFARVVQRRNDVHLVLAGPDERGGEALVRQLIHQYSIAKHVTMTGMLGGQERLSVLVDCDVFVLASPSEGTSLALLEAMYIGLPVIVTDRVGLSTRIQRESCGLVVERDVKALEDRLCYMAATETRKEMGKRGHNLVKSEFCWDSIAFAFLTHISERLP